MRYRYHHGTNLGSVFILERWLTPSMFHESAKGSSELAAVEAWVKLEGIEKTRERFERHWREYVTDSDLDWLLYGYLLDISPWDPRFVSVLLSKRLLPCIKMHGQPSSTLS